MKTALIFTLTTTAIWAQDWKPSKIVEMAEYPALAHLARIQGTVEVKCILDSGGAVVTAESLSGPSELREFARQNALRWRFQRVSKEALNNNLVTLKYRFLLKGEPQPQNRTRTTFVFEPPDKIQVVTTPPTLRGAD
jgi:TonB family protein